MRTATVFEAKTNLSELLRYVKRGEEVLITSGREREPVARLVAVDPLSAKRRIGFMKGLGSVGPEFFEPLPEEELRLWSGEDK